MSHDFACGFLVYEYFIGGENFSTDITCEAADMNEIVSQF